MPRAGQRMTYNLRLCRVAVLLEVNALSLPRFLTLRQP